MKKQTVVTALIAAGIIATGGAQAQVSSEGGPVMVGIPGHFIVVSGIDFNDESQAYYLYVNDPLNSGPDWRLLETVENGYEADWEFSYDMLQR